MKRGAVALLDALGFKGIWRDHSSGDVLAALRSVAKFASEAGEIAAEALSEVSEFSDVKVEVSAFSDTLLITATTDQRPDKPPLPQDAYDQWSTIAEISAVAMVGSVSPILVPPLLYRGAIAFGEFEVSEGRFYVGPAIDEAAEFESIADGAFVCLTPSAMRLILGEGDGFLIKGWPVPLKNGQTYVTDVVNPLRHVRGPDFLTMAKRVARDEASPQDDPTLWLTNRILNVFGSSKLDLVLKRQHTEALLNRARQLVPPPVPPSVAQVFLPPS